VVKPAVAQGLVRPQHLVLLAVMIVLVLGLLGLGIWVGGWNLWAEWHSQAAKKAEDRRDFEEQHAHLLLCLEIWPHSAETHFLAARAARRAGRYDEAEHHLAACKEYGWVEEALRLERSLLLAQRGKLQPVENTLLGWVNQDHPESTLILEALAQGYLLNYQLPEALNCLDLWLKREPDEVRALVWRGKTRERMMWPADAMKDYGRAVELDPTQDEARQRLAGLLLHGHRPGEALAHYRILSQDLPGDAAVQLGLARCLVELSQTEEARRVLDGLLAAFPHDSQALGERGTLALNMGENAEAEKWLRQSAAIDPYDSDVAFSLYKCLEALGKQDEAHEWFARHEKIDADMLRIQEVTAQIRATPRDAALRKEAGELFLRNGLDQEGVRWLESALQQDPNHAPTHQLLADYYERAGQPALAQRHRQHSQK
jgi:tetratricopeptide (TPR) repeat protein